MKMCLKNLNSSSILCLTFYSNTVSFAVDFVEQKIKENGFIEKHHRFHFSWINS